MSKIGKILQRGEALLRGYSNDQASLRRAVEIDPFNTRPMLYE